MRYTLLSTAAALGLALAVPAMAQTARQPLPATPSTVQDGTPAAGTDTGAAPGQDPAARTNVPGAMNGTSPAPNNTAAPGVVMNPSTNPSTATPADQGAAPQGSMASGQDTTTSSDQSSQSAQGTHNNMMRRTHHAVMGAGGEGHWAHQPGTGESGPASSVASNIDSADTHSKIAPHFPQPAGGENAGPTRYLHDAENALRHHRTGEADQALEMAETRLLDRSTPASDANQVDQRPEIQQVENARKALASGDMQSARTAINTALASAGGGEGGMSGGSNGAPAAPPQGNAMGAAGPAPAQAVGGGSGGGPLGTPSADSAGGTK